MPYFSIEDLPATVRKYLPKRAQEIYRKAFNKTWDHYHDPKYLPKNVSKVEIAAMVAWTAVKKEYRRTKKKWIKRQIPLRIIK
jgi:cation transport regulator